MLSTQNTLKNNNNNWFTQDEFLKRKKINQTIFQNIPTTFQSSLSEHSSFAFDHFYAVPYLKKTQKSSTIARFHHGIAHANRVANYVPVFANLYRKYDDQATLQLTNDELKFIQLAGLFHDVARENDDIDQWDKDSAILLYLYLKAIGVDEKKAILLAEAIANKDADETSKGYEELHINKDGAMAWQRAAPRPKNCYQMLLHDSDCIDIIRARDHFKGKKLDFFKRIAEKNAVAFAEMAELITEVRSVIETQGDSRQVPKKDIKSLYEQRDGYTRSLQIFKQPGYRMLSILGNDNKLLPQTTLKALSLIDVEPYDPDQGLEIANLKRAMQEGKIFARGMVIVSGKSAKKITNEDGTTVDETLTALELRKAARRLGVPTTSSKPNKDGSKPNIEKQANPNRSVCMLGYGAAPFSDAGFLLINPNRESITSVSIKDADTGFGKKNQLTKQLQQSLEIEEKLNELHQLLMQGGSSRQFRSMTATHNEITYNIDHYDAIYFTQDPNFANRIYTGKSTAFHRYAPFLSAYYLQNEYKKQHGKTLNIFEYSGLHNSLREVKPEEYTEEVILQMWSTMIRDYLHSLKKSFKAQALLLNKNAIDKLKVLAMYGAESFENSAYHVNAIMPADQYYSESLRRAIGHAAELAINEVLDSYSDFCKFVVAHLKDDFDRSIEQHLLNLHDDQIIDEIIENKPLFNYLINEYSILHLVDAYWERHQKPAIAKGFVNFSNILRGNKRLLETINAGKLTGYTQDEYGRYERIANPRHHLHTHISNYLDDLTGCDFSKFNFDGYTFKKFKFRGTNWQFVQSDKVTFTKCYMDDFSFTKDSDLSGVNIQEPIFSSNEVAKKIASLFETIPTFILQNQYITEVKALLKAGKKIHFDDHGNMYKRLHKMIVDNEFELFCVVLKSLEGDCRYAEHFKELLVNAIDTQQLKYIKIENNNFLEMIFQSLKDQKKAEKHKNDNGPSAAVISNENRFCFAEAIVKHHVLELQAEKNNYELMTTANRVKNYSAIALLLSHNTKPNDIIHDQAIFQTLRALLNLLPDNRSIDEETKIKINLSKAHANRKLPFYAFAERLLYICTYLRKHDEMSQTKLLVKSLIDELELAYHAYFAKNDGENVLQNINAKQMGLLKELEQDDALLQKAFQVDDRGLNRFDAYTYNNKIDLQEGDLSQDDIADLCGYLQQNPHINKIRICDNQLASESISLLTSVSSVHKLTFASCQLNEGALKILAKAHYLTNLAIGESKNNGITINVIKALASNLIIKDLEYRYNNQAKEERRIWKKIMRETDLDVRANFGIEAEYEFIQSKKLSKSHDHVAGLEKKQEHAIKGKQARCKSNILHKQILFFRDRIPTDSNEISKVDTQPDKPCTATSSDERSWKSVLK